MCFAARWVGERSCEFRSDFHDGHYEMVKRAWELLDEADAVLHFNGSRFDVPHLQREFLQSGFLPPSPFKQIDLLKTYRSRFKFISNKLAFVSKHVGEGGKVQHEGFPLWIKCMEGDAKAWARMKKYNVKDVDLTIAHYEHLKPWIKNHPSHGAHTGTDICPKCGSGERQSRGYAFTATGKYQRYQCKGCGGWSRASRRVEGTAIVQIAD